MSYRRSRLKPAGGGGPLLLLLLLSSSLALLGSSAGASAQQLPLARKSGSEVELTPVPDPNDPNINSIGATRATDGFKWGKKEKEEEKKSVRNVKEFQAYKLKKYIYIYSTKKYSFNEAETFCYAKGYTPVPYEKREHQEAVNAICYESGRGCWVGGQQGNYCAYVDPDGNGSAYARYCDEKQYVLCYGKIP
ncbi:hypothetical protein VOLCADRAFT_90722 [Volvox carteri f. nagariensis]|uniref:C-type lectin domain-containing protein n=1 Tax=Volvox carteri f. nagariensis TaxID=3068 RepID=D8TVJ8_VOLCA|nr:uncharacterized protein VOLCADRAFT_90722 [Volvox carteri f. nagariensis]EFJ48593.1 hypothetical protein VOLCADRAFT_90722 [Volvox carteri f. nagariensis]|eukprot:XP_002950392.1 hypothetical protein VOLCADRAFT_90722 [Volvox carteri f. nagariensis]